MRRWHATGPLLLALTVLALITRAIGLNGGLWIDEVYSLVRSFRSSLGTILTEYWGDNHHPLYAVLAHGSRALFGESAWSIRLPAMLLGTASVPLTYLVGARLADRRSALWGAALLAVSYHHVWFSQNARGYTGLAFFSLLALLAVLRAVEEGAWRWVVLYAVAAALGAYTHLTMVFVAMGQAVVVGLGWWAARGTSAARRMARVSVAFPLAALFTLALYAPMLHPVIAFFTSSKSGLLGISTPSWALREGMRVLGLGVGTERGPLIAGVGALAAFTFGVGLRVVWRRSPHACGFVVAPILTTMLGAFAARGTMYPRFFFFAIGPAIVVGIAGGFAMIEWLGARLRLPTAVTQRLATVGLTLLTVLSAGSLLRNYRSPKQDFAGAMEWVESRRRPEDAVATAGLTADPYRMLYGRNWPVLTTVGQLDSVRAGHATTWVLITFRRYLDRQSPALGDRLRELCPEAQMHVFPGTVGDGDIRVCTLNAS